jgi:hypothetical protein
VVDGESIDDVALAVATDSSRLQGWNNRGSFETADSAHRQPEAGRVPLYALPSESVQR